MTCPWLVKAVDAWEAEGAVEELNRSLLERPTGPAAAEGAELLSERAKGWRRKLEATHQDVREIRTRLLTSDIRR